MDILNELYQIDKETLLFLNSFHSNFFDHFMWIVTGKWVWVPMYCTIFYVIIKNLKLPAACLTIAAFVLVIVYSDQFCATILRPLFHRMRPSNVENELSALLHLVNGYRGGYYGFPSCHSANSFGLAFITYFIFRNRKVTFFIMLWAILNSYSRIYTGVHYPSDILGGLVVGFSGALIVYSFYRKVLSSSVCTGRLQISETEFMLNHSVPFKNINFLIYIEMLTILAIAIYSLLKGLS